MDWGVDEDKELREPVTLVIEGSTSSDHRWKPKRRRESGECMWVNVQERTKTGTEVDMTVTKSGVEGPWGSFRRVPVGVKGRREEDSVVGLPNEITILHRCSQGWILKSHGEGSSDRCSFFYVWNYTVCSGRYRVEDRCKGLSRGYWKTECQKRGRCDFTSVVFDRNVCTKGNGS